MGGNRREKKKKFEESKKYTGIEDKKKREKDKIEKERTAEMKKEFGKYISEKDVKVEKERLVEINKGIATQMASDGLKRNKKLIEMKLRGSEEPSTDANDKVLSYFQMRAYLRAMRRFKCLVYFYHGADEEHPLYNEKTALINHLYYETETPKTIADKFFKYMYGDKILKNKTQRESLFKKQAEMPEDKMDSSEA